MKDLLRTLLEKAINECYKKDRYLIDKGMEQASVARIFYYMQRAIEFEDDFDVLREYHLDCEYYKHGEDKKITESHPKGSRPDVILHKRGTDDDNLLIIEFKSYSNNDCIDDYIKLKEFTSVSEVYRYSLGIFAKLNRRETEYVYFQNGKEVEKTELK